MEESELIHQIAQYFDQNIFQQHMVTVLKKHSRLKNYKVNPIVVKYLSEVLVNEYTPEGVAKALYYPRVLGTSINTTFGTGIQKMFIVLGIAEPSLIKGMDVEFIDKLDGRKKWCQLKAGPNTINSEDVGPLIAKFSKTIRLARTNNSTLSNNDFVVGVLYGENHELSRHYNVINEIHPVFIGKDFWHRVTGYPDFYKKLVVVLHQTISKLQTEDFFNRGLSQLIEDVKNSDLFEFTES